FECVTWPKVRHPTGRAAHSPFVALTPNFFSLFWWLQVYQGIYLLLDVHTYTTSSNTHNFAFFYTAHDTTRHATRHDTHRDEAGGAREVFCRSSRTCRPR